MGTKSGRTAVRLAEHLSGKTLENPGTVPQSAPAFAIKREHSGLFTWHHSVANDSPLTSDRWRVDATFLEQKIPQTHWTLSAHRALSVPIIGSAQPDGSWSFIAVG